MSDFYTGKVVVVTGGTDGIGKALVEELISSGARVATCARNHDKLYLLQTQYPSAHLHTMVADVSSENDCRRFIEDRKSTRLNSSHSQISYAVFCLKKKKKKINI